MSELKYDAFISYRHSDIDSKAAGDIQKLLERYRIPKSLQKKLGKKKIERIFRDKEELPITSDLNDDIGEALEHSEFLIVICSPRLKESIWCMKEIETFLQTHDQRNVLTVLAEGEPYDVIPEMLLYQDVTNPDGTKERKMIEPLSCDWRLPRRRMIREELPRLAAMILGCRYDDLIQRQKQYRMRRFITGMAATMAVLTGFLIYAVISNIKINENYIQSLKNQSGYLASESEKALKNGDRFVALKLALEALPKDTDDQRPVIPTVVHALEKAGNAYNSYSDSLITKAYYETDGLVNREYCSVTTDEKYLFAYDGAYMYLWDTGANKQIYKKTLSGYNGDEFCADGDYYYTADTTGISAWSVVDNSLVWSTDQMDQYRQKVFALNGCLYLNHLDGGFTRIDISTGEILAETKIPEKEKREKYISWFKPEYSDKGYLAGMSSDEVEDGYHFIVADAETNHLIKFDEVFALIDTAIVKNRKAYILAYKEEDANWNSVFAGMETASENILTMVCYDLDSGKMDWSLDLPFYQTEEYSAIYQRNTGVLDVFFSNVVCSLSPEGKVLSRCEARGPFTVSYVRNDRLWGITEDGYMCMYDPEKNQLFSMKELSRGPSCMILTENSFYYPAKTSGMMCLGTEKDENIETWYEDASEEYLYHTAYVDQLMLTVQADILGKEGAVRCFDLKEKKLNWSFDFYKELGEEARYVDDLGVSEAKDAVWYWIHGSTYENLSAVVKLDLLSGESKVYDLTGLVTDVSFVNDKLFMVKNNGNVSIFDLTDWEMLPYAEAAEKGFTAVSFGPVQSVFKDAQAELFLYDPQNGSFTDLNLQWNDNTKILMGEDTFFIADEEQVSVYDYMGKNKGISVVENSIPANVYALEERGLYVVLENRGMVTFYDHSASLVGSLQLDKYIYEDSCFVEGDELFFGSKGAMNVVDLTDYSICLTVPHAQYYCSETNEFILADEGTHGGVTLQSVRRYSLDELKERAQNLLGEFELSNTQKKEFGLE